jgi:hypothetical protein
LWVCCCLPSTRTKGKGPACACVMGMLHCAVVHVSLCSIWQGKAMYAFVHLWWNKFNRIYLGM